MKTMRYLTVFLLVVLVGCATLDNGADPLVVRVEQAEQLAKSAFDAVLQLDNANRPFWRTNAPGFHQFCEWLRAPVKLTNYPVELPRASAMIFSLNVEKNAYKARSSSSNTLWNAFAAFESIVTQAGAWMTIATNQPAR